jgi:glycosyltransferase involved in cell wall biosynthesis
MPMRKSLAGGVVQVMNANHIALVFHDFSTGGSERIAIRLANAWAASGRRVTIFCGTEEGRARALVSDLIVVVPSNPPIRRGWMSRIRLGWKLPSMFESYRPDIMFAPGNFHLSVLAVAARRSVCSGMRFVCKISNPLVPHGTPKLLSKAVSLAMKMALKPIDQLTAMSPLLANEAGAVLPGRTFARIDEPVLDNPPRPALRRLLPDQSALILCIGRLEAQKDFGLALRAFAELSPLSSARLVILGEGPDREKLRLQAVELGISGRVEFPGHVTDVADWMARARLLLMTSHFEGFPAVLIESRAVGLPIVSTDCSAALSEIISCACHGEIVQGRAPGEIAAAISRQLSVPSVDGAEVARGTERFLIDNIAPQWLTLFDRIVV